MTLGEAQLAVGDAPVSPPDAVEPVALPMSMAQQRMWLIEQLEPGRPAYHVPLVCRLRGTLDAAALEQALNQIVSRHEVLRTTFDKMGTLQIIAPALSLPIELHDLTNLNESEREAKAHAAIDAQIQKPFDLCTGPLLRAGLLRLASDEHVLILVMHHVICDGWSIDVMMSELSHFYRTACDGGEPETLPELPIQYADYAQWQHDWLQGETLDALTKHWKERLSDVPTLDLPLDHQRPAVLTSAGDTLSLIIPDSLRDSLAQLARQERASMFMVLLAAFKVLLARYSGQDDLAVGTPIAGRTRTELDPLIGFFANMLVLRTDMTGNPTFAQLVARVRTTALDAYDHQDLPFERLVEELRPRRSRNRHPLFQVAFLYGEGPQRLPDLPGVAVSAVPFKMGIAKFDLMLAVFNRADGLHCSLEFSTELFAAATIRAMLGHFHVLLQSITAHPNQPVKSLPLMSEDERQTVLHRFNDTSTMYPRDQTIDGLFESQAAQSPNAPAVIDGSATTTYAQLARRVSQLAAALVHQGIKPGDRVAICLHRSTDLIAALLAILRCGGAYVPLDPDYPADRLRFMLDDAGVSLVIIDQTIPQELHASLIASATIPCIAIDTLKDVIAGAATNAATTSTTSPATTSPIAPHTADDLAYLIFTSGSTGTPKAVAVPHRGVVRLVKGADYVPFGPGLRFLLLAPVSFDASTFELWGPLLNGGVCVIHPHRVPQLDQLEATLRDQRIDCLWLTAAMFNTVIDQRPAALATVRFLLIGGEALSPAHVRRAQIALPNTQIINGYGPTESTTFTCTHPIPPLPANALSVPIGRPINNTQTYILDDQLSPTPIGVPGELYIGGDGLARGYWNRPKLTEERFIPDPFTTDPDRRLYRSGDRCRWKPDGTLEYLGRLDQQVKLRGFRIEPGEIEAALAKHPHVKQSIVVIDGQGNDRRLVAYVVPGGQPPSRDDLARHLKRMLPAYMVPAVFMIIDAMPLSPAGKIDRAALPAPVLGRQDHATPAEPCTKVERELVALWSQMLGIKHVDIHDNFFDLGGHSLAAVGLFDQINVRFGKSLPLATLFDHPTIAELAPFLRNEREVPKAPILVPLKATGTQPPFFCVHGIGGDLLFLKPLAKAMPDDQPFYGLRAMGTDEREEPDTDIAAMARRYVQAIRAMQPAGPYHIGGFSSGGTIAFEMARQLVRDGCEVGLLAVFDHAPLNLGRRRSPWHPAQMARWMYNLPFYVLDDLLRPARKVNLASRVKGKLRVWRKKIMHRIGVARPPKQRLDFQAMFGVTTLSNHRKSFLQTHYDALRQYQPQPYDGCVTLFRARTRPLFQMDLPEARWRLIARQVDAHVIPGSHEGIFRHPNVLRVAEELARCLR